MVECDWCRGCGFILEDKDAFYYFGHELVERANSTNDKDMQRTLIEKAKSMRGIPMQPLAHRCPKCGGSGWRGQNKQTGEEKDEQKRT